MSEETKIYCPFAIKDNFDNMASEIKPSDNSIEVKRALFSNEGFKIKTSFSGSVSGYNLGYLYTKGLATNTKKKYNKQYRREVLWDFGDGTKKMGYSVEHYYKKPGRYCITCTFFDINRKGYKNSFCAYVIVKELIPTQLSFVKQFTSSDDTKTVYTKSDISCSKIERIARMECLVSNTVDKEFDVFVKRTDDTTHPSYFDLKDNGNLHETRYWTTLRNEQLLYYRTNQVYSNWLQPSDTFIPNYSKIYYRLTYNSETKERDFEFYQVIPYKDIDDILNYITVLNPNGDVRQKASTKTYKITQKYTQEQLPSDAVYCGLRGFVDIFYKNDIVNDSSDFSIFYDIETENITGELKSSANYLNINPLGLTVKTNANSLDKVKLAASGNYFLKEVEGGAKLTDKDKVYIDPYFEGSLYKGLNLTCYVFPFCTYEGEDVIMLDSSYYVPKDINLSIECKQKIDDEFESGTNSKSIVQDQDESIEWLKKIELELNNYIDLEIDGTLNNTTKRTIKVVQKPLLNIENISIPKEKQSKVDIDRLLQSYMIHPMFSETSVLKDFVKAYLNTFIQKTTTHSNNFIDNVANSKTCYLSNLIAQLKMMGDDVTEYEYTNFDGINDLKKFARLLSMNHSDLVGHTREKDWDIYIIKDNKGANVGDVISLDSKITLDTTLATYSDDEDSYGKIQKIEDKPVDYDNGVDLIVHDKYTNDVKMVNFRTYLKKYRNNEVYLKDYNEDWGWNLLLPENFEILNEKIAFYEQKAKNKAYAKSQIVSFEKEAERLKQKKRELIDGYYDFYVLIPKKEVERVGHFLEEEDITSKIESVKEWKSDWGIAHDVLMKILLTNGLMTSERDFEDYQGNLLWETVLINESKTFNRGEIPTTIYVENKIDNFEVKGIVTIRGKIFAEGENTLYVTLSDGVIDNKDGFEIENGASITIVVQGRDINEQTHEIPLKGKRIKEDSNLIIKISENSTIDNPNVEISAKIHYDPAVVSGYINCNNNHEVAGQIFNKEDDELDENFNNQKIIHNSTISVVNGFVEGVGVNSVPLSFTAFSVTQKPYEDKDKITSNELKNIKFDLSDPRLTFNVNDEGEIEHDGETFTFNGQFTKYLTIKEGTITVQLTGTVKYPLLEIVGCKISYYYDYPQLLQSYNLSDFSSKVSLTNGKEEKLTFDERLGELITNAILSVHPVETQTQCCFETEDNFIILLDDENAIDVKQLSEFVTETTNLKTFINDFSLSLTRNEDETEIEGEDKYYTCLISGKYNIESYGEWILEPIELLVSGEITITKFGDVDGELTLAIKSDKIINSSIELTFKVSGDICRGNATLEIVTNKEPRCIYVKTFYLNETFNTKGNAALSIGKAVSIKGFQDVEKVNVRFTDSLRQTITTLVSAIDDSVEETNGNYLIIEAYNEIITPQHTYIDGETGEEVLVPATISKDIIYKQEFEVDNSSVTVDENGEIAWNGMEVTPIYTTDYERVLIDSDKSKLSINSNNFGIEKFDLEGKIKDYTYFGGKIELSSTEDKANVESIQRTFNGHCVVTVSGRGVLWDDRDTDVDLILEYKPEIEVTNKKTDEPSSDESSSSEPSYVSIFSPNVTKTVTVDKDGFIKIDDGLPTVEFNFTHFDEDEVPSDEYDENGNLIESDIEIEDEYDENGNLIEKTAINDGDFNYTLSGSLSMSGNVQNVTIKELLEDLFTITVVDTSFALDNYYTWDNPNVSGGYKVNVNGKIKKNIEDSYADITITNIDFNIGDYYISEVDRQAHVTFDENYTIENITEFNVLKTENHVDYVIEGNITVTIEHENDQDADNYGPDLSVTNEITKADRIDRKISGSKDQKWNVENKEDDSGFTISFVGWKEGVIKGLEEDGEATINIIPDKTITISGHEFTLPQIYDISILLDEFGTSEQTSQSITSSFTENHIDYLFDGTIYYKIDKGIIDVNHTINYSEDDRKFTEIPEEYSWIENDESFGGFTVEASGWRKGETEDGYLELNVIPKSIIFENNFNVVDFVESQSKSIVLNGNEQDVDFSFNYENTIDNVDYSFTATLTITPSLLVINKNAVFKITNRNFEIDKPYNWSDFTIDGVDETANLVGGFNVKVENGVMGQENTFDVTINRTTIDENELTGNSSYTKTIEVDKDGNITNGDIIPFDLKNQNGYDFTGEIVISGNVKELDTLVTIQNCEIIKPLYIAKQFEWKDYISNLNISGGFNVDAYYNQSSDTIQFTMYCGETMIDDKILNGSNAIPLAVSVVDENGNITPQYDGEFELFDSDGYYFCGKINVIGTLTNIDVEIFDVVYKEKYINCDVSEANGYCPDAYKNGSDSWNTVVLTPNMDKLQISIVNEKGEMLNDE